ncbi:phage tail assembly chaperone [Pseudomonas syringae]|uniref:Tail assembly chaperone n=1 Tax=Pseudomonas syringae TaxID=317 RepID=A0A085V3Y4_PSESX|nr:phage tail assembly chaperone [Pseudomonas syringae]KFE50147.1 hypothetical protein IV01_26105 [Pseudomonas syringae]
MAKISFQQNPTFKVDVEIPRVGGSAVKVPFTFNYLNRDQLAEFTDAEIQYSKEISDLIKDEQPSVKEVSAKAEEFQFDQLKKAINSWGFSEDLTDDNLRAVIRSAVAVPIAILDAYKGAYNKAREGNLPA